MRAIEAEYLVIGAGAAGMAFTDALIADSDADVVMVDRRHRPGGHWNDAYPFVRLHQPSAFYGVNSRALGNDTVDTTGPNAGLYERATGTEICAYFEAALNEQLLPSGKVRFFGMSDYLGEEGGQHLFRSLVTGQQTALRVRRRVVDATFLETSVPSTHTPSFGVDPDARFIPVNDLVEVSGPTSGYTVIGGGKTGMDACVWLLDNGVEPDRIRWIRPRDAWLLNRVFQQPLQQLPWLIEGVSLYLEAAAEAETDVDLFRRLEAAGQMLRLDPEVAPSMFRCATVSEGELVALRSIEKVVRLGRVLHVGADRIVLEEGSIPTGRSHVHVDCSASGLRARDPRPVFEPSRITLQQIRACQPVFSIALTGYVAATREDDVEANGLCPPNRYPSAAADWIPLTYTAQRAQGAWAEPDVAAWSERSRLNGARGVGDHAGDPRMQSALRRLLESTEPALENLDRLRRIAQPTA